MPGIPLCKKRSAAPARQRRRHPLIWVTAAYLASDPMCTVVLLRRPDHDWPLILGANRDEMVGRPSKPPARHWPDRPEVVAGLDELAHGSWLGCNDHGVAAAILNRHGTLGPAAGFRSRGELVLEALDHADAADRSEEHTSELQSRVDLV